MISQFVQQTKRLLFGALVCLSFDNFKSFVVAIVAGKRHPDDLERGILQLKFFEDINNLEIYKKRNDLQMIESTSLFEVSHEEKSSFN